MPGFGSGPLGGEPAGEDAWARRVLWDLIPELYKNQDTDGTFQLFIEGLYPSFTSQRRLARDFAELRDPLLVRTRYNTFRRLKLGKVIIPLGDVEQQGINATVDATFKFTAPTARFHEEDVGKEITVRGSSVTGNNKTVVIVGVDSLNGVFTYPELQTDTGPLRWELRPSVTQAENITTLEVRAGDVSNIVPGWLIWDGRADYTVEARRQFLASGGLAFQTEKEGVDGDIDSSTLRFAASSANFEPQDVGKFLSISSSNYDDNIGKFEITDIDMTTSPPRLTLRGFMVADSELEWAVLPHAEIDITGTAIPDGYVEQGGTDLELLGGATGDVRSITGSFDPDDVGKFITILGSLNGQDGRYEITVVTDSINCTVDATFATAETDLFWELRRTTLTGDHEKRGDDLQIEKINSPAVGQTTLYSPTGVFDPTDVGLTINLSNSPISSNDGDYVIVDALGPERVVLGTVLAVDGPIDWYIESEDFTVVEAIEESILKQMAPDFGIELDNQETEARQRSWVYHVNRWLDRKGHEKGYIILGNISGFDVTVYALYRISVDYIGGLPADFVYEVGDTGVGRQGNDGALTYDSSAGRVKFSAATAAFRAGDTGRTIRARDTNDPWNSKLFTIESVPSATEVLIRPADGGVTPDYGITGTAANPLIEWDIVRVFTSLPPMQPLFDEFNPDQLTYYVLNNPPAGDDFSLDKYCWEDDFAAFVDVTVISATQIGGGLRYEITVSGEADVVLDPAAFDLVTSTNQSFRLETVPVAAGPNFTFEVVATPNSPPALGAGTLQYVCRVQERCGFCKASEILILLEAGSVVTEGDIATERLLERVLDRLYNVLPVHVKLIPRFRQTLQASAVMSATIITGRITTSLVAPFTAYYDVIEGDAIVTDTTIVVTITTP